MISKFRIGALVIILNFFASVAMIWGQDNPGEPQEESLPSTSLNQKIRQRVAGNDGSVEVEYCDCHINK